MAARKMTMRRKILMIPGPTEVSEEVRQELAKPVTPHYGSDWVGLYKETIAMLKKVFKTKGDMFVLVGSSSAAMEASVMSAIEPGDKVLVELSGNFGLRFKEIVEAQGGKVVPLNVELGKAVDPDDVKRILEQDRCHKGNDSSSQRNIHRRYEPCQGTRRNSKGAWIVVHSRCSLIPWWYRAKNG